jgi:glutathione S-transferase
MDLRLSLPGHRYLAEAQVDIDRVIALWGECRMRFGAGGPFLFGRFCAADAMYAPIVSRFQTYQVDVSAPAAAYMRAVMALPAWQEWRRAALRETWVIPKFEYDWPDVKRLAADAA